MENAENFSKSKSMINTKTDEEALSSNKRFNFKGKKLSFSQASEISDDTKDNHKLFSPVRKLKIFLFITTYYIIVIC